MMFGVLALMAMAGAAMAQEALTPARVFASPDLSGPSARGVQLAPDGSAVAYLKVKAADLQVTDLWIADVSGGAPRMLIDGGALTPKGRTLSEAEKSRRERKGVQTHGVVDYAWDEQGRFILAPVEGDCGSTTAPAENCASSPTRLKTRSTPRSRPRAAMSPSSGTTTSMCSPPPAAASAP